MDISFIQQSNHGIMDEEDDFDSISSSSSNGSNLSSSSDFLEDATSSSPSMSSLSSSPTSDHIDTNNTKGGPLYEMASLMQQLPFKRGLSKHYQGKSQSFTSLSNVRSLEDLAKLDNPCKKKMKSCKSYGGGLSETSNKVSHPKTCSKIISKKTAARGSWSSLAAKRNNSFLGNRPPVPPQRTCSTLFNQTSLFA
ncbi:hypothetical protein IFM89_007780 [Coptis chinensis]|uniref:Oxidative stress 3 n=1 Tax=Coptis chinensis TaxID=261450 RepID=A0A835MC10_9MAGN|nr:hypothetical protein IFM89_007780 [Coptis chinensis]